MTNRSIFCSIDRISTDSASSSSSGYTPAPVYEDEGTEADWDYDATVTDEQNDSDSPTPDNTTTQPAEDGGVLPPKTTVPAEEPEPEVNYEPFNNTLHAEELLYGPAERALYTVPDAVDTGCAIEADGIMFYYDDSGRINKIAITGGFYGLYTVQCGDIIDYAVNNLPDYGFETDPIDPDDYQYAWGYSYLSQDGIGIDLLTTDEGFISKIEVY